MPSDESKYMGIDVSKGWIDVYLLCENRSCRVTNTYDSLKEWAATLPEGITAVIEATGGFHNQAVAVLSEAGIPVCIVNPKAIHHFAKALQLKAKTDEIDARLIALFGRCCKPKPQPLPTKEQARLKDIVTRRGQLIEIQTAEKNRWSMVKDELVRTSIDAHREWIAAEIERIDRDIEAMFDRDDSWKQNLERLTSVPGVGVKTARALLADFPELGTLNAKSAAALAGLAPFTRESGIWKGRSYINGGRSGVRRALYMATLTATRCNPVIRAFYQLLINRGKPFKVAITACMRKLVVILNALLRDEKNWIFTTIHP
jgi:transposase